MTNNDEAEQQKTIQGDEKEKFLKKLDASLNVLSTNLRLGIDDKQLGLLKAFGDREKWDWQKLPQEGDIYRAMAELVDRVRHEYSWLSWQNANEDYRDNRGWFEQIGISKSSGLPWAFDFVELKRLRDRADGLLGKLPSYEGSRDELKRLIKGDNVELNQVGVNVLNINKNSMKRNFLEKLKGEELIGWGFGDNEIIPHARKELMMGGEDLWNVSAVRFMPASGTFEIYIVDTWQDIREPQITEVDGEVKVSRELASSLRFGADNAAWYMLKEIDQKFKSLHPVHVTRAVVGPYENRYLDYRKTTFKPLAITKEILGKDPQVGLLRFERQYAYAPNQRDVGDEVRQIVYLENWQDEIIICPSKFSSDVARSVLGTNVRIFED
jgi:hypothetical protein